VLIWGFGDVLIWGFGDVLIWGFGGLGMVSKKTSKPPPEFGCAEQQGHKSNFEQGGGRVAALVVG